MSTEPAGRPSYRHLLAWCERVDWRFTGYYKLAFAFQAQDPDRRRVASLIVRGDGATLAAFECTATRNRWADLWRIGEPDQPPSLHIDGCSDEGRSTLLFEGTPQELVQRAMEEGATGADQP